MTRWPRDVGAVFRGAVQVGKAYDPGSGKGGGVSFGIALIMSRF